MYGREELRLLRERQRQAVPQSHQAPLLEQIPADAPMDDAMITVWNGGRFVAYDKWLATVPVVREEKPEKDRQGFPADAECVAGECGGTRVWLVKDGERWLMYGGSRKAGGRRRDFATPYLEHAIRTAEQWYGAPASGWRLEKGRDGSRRDAADLSPQDSTNEKGTGERGHDDLDLGGQESGRG
jgi:hypothetical protein